MKYKTKKKHLDYIGKYLHGLVIGKQIALAIKVMVDKFNYIKINNIL